MVHFLGRFGIAGGGLRFDPGRFGIDGGALNYYLLTSWLTISNLRLDRVDCPPGRFGIIGTGDGAVRCIGIDDGVVC